MAHKNRWFTELANGDVPWQTVSHNQMVTIKSPLTQKGKNVTKDLNKDGYVSH